MKKSLLLLASLLPLLLMAQQDSLLSGVYTWQEPVGGDKNILTKVLFEGKVHDMQFLQMSANTVLPTKKKFGYQPPINQEYLIIIKSGTLMIDIRDSSYTIGPGSIALLMPKEQVKLQSKDSCKFYLMKYTSKEPIDLERGRISGGSLVRDWNKLEFIPQERSGRRNFFERPTAMCRRFEMHTTTLKEGIQSHDPHRHKAEEIVLVIENNTEMVVGEQKLKGGVGSIYYLGSNVLHGIRNDGKGLCTYFAFQFD